MHIDMEAEKRIVEFLKKNPNSSMNKIAESLKLDGRIVLNIVSDLVENDKAKMSMIRPLGNSEEPNNSCFYSIKRNT